MRLTSMRRFRPDPLLPAVSVVERSPEVEPAPGPPARGEVAGPGTRDPVIEAIRSRAEARSKPGARSDGRRIVLVIEGGGMRGAVSAGMAAALEQLDLTDSFDAVYGASAGAFNAAFLLAEQAGYLTALYPHGFGNPRFAMAVRILAGRAPFDMDYVIERVWREQRPLHTERILARGIELHCAATDIATAAPVDLTELASDLEIRTALRASARLPWLAGPPVEFRGRRLLDATLSEAIPITTASGDATDLLVLQTRPHGIAHTPLSGGVAKLTDRYLMRMNPRLVELRRTRSERYDLLTAELSRRAADSEARPRVCVIRPPSGTPMIGQLESRAALLVAAGGHGFRAAWRAFTGAEPELLRPLRAYA